MRMKRNLKAIPVLVAGLFTSQLSIAAGSVSADPHAGHDMSATNAAKKIINVHT